MATTDKIKALFVYEVLGRPPEHIKAALEDFIAKLDSQKGIKVESKKIHEPTPCEDEHAQDLFTTFAEVELLIDDLNLLFAIVYNTLPASVEIIGPSEMNLKNFDLSSIITDLTLKLHKYDEVAKTISIEKAGLINIVKELQTEIERLNSKGIQQPIAVNTDITKEVKKAKKNKESKNQVLFKSPETSRLGFILSLN